jgi:hypothetical protein
MKKFWITAIALVGINFAVSAQEKREIAPEVQAKKELALLVETFQLKDNAQQQLFELLTKKHQAIKDAGSADAAKAIKERFNTIILQELGDDVVAKMKSNPELFSAFITKE